jgi:hypothetical protein
MLTDHDEPAPYQGVAEMRSTPGLAMSELKQVSSEDLYQLVGRSLDFSPFVRHDWRSMAAKFTFKQVQA